MFTFSAPETVLAVLAHPDDAELTCFGTLARFSDAGARVVVAALATDYRLRVNVTPPGRQNEAAAAARVIGAESRTFQLPDGSVDESNVTFSVVNDLIREVRPRVLFTHFSTGELDHQDHRAIGRVASIVGWRSANVTTILQVPPPILPTDFTPNLFVDITEVIEKKIDALSCYVSQKDKYYFDTSYVLSRHMHWAAIGGAEDVKDAYFEAFKIVKASA